MYLAKRKVVGKGFYSGYDKLPKRLPEDVLLVLVQKLRNGDTTVCDEIILGHLGLTIQVVGRYVAYFPTKADDLMGEGQTELVRSVYKFPYASRDDKITPYIVSNLHGRLSRFLREEDFVVPISTRGYEEAAREANESGSNVSNMLSKSTNIEALEVDPTQFSRYSSVLTYGDDNTDLEIKEIFSKCRFTRFETLVYDRLVSGMKETEIAKELSYSKQRIWQIKQQIIIKLTPFFLEEQIDESLR